MAKIVREDIIISGTLLKNSGSLQFKAAGVQAFLLPFVGKKLAHLNFELTPANLKFKASFATKYEDEQFSVNLNKTKDFEITEIIMELPDFNVVLDRCNLFVTQSESFIDLTEAAINESIKSGQFDSILNQENTPWTDDEENVALELYIKCDRGRDATLLKELISSAILEERIARSAQAVYMKVYQYQSLDNGVTQEGLGNISKKTIENLRRFKQNASEN